MILEVLNFLEASFADFWKFSTSENGLAGRHFYQYHARAYPTGPLDVYFLFPIKIKPVQM